MKRIRHAFPALVASLALAACATVDEGDYPSLAKRDAERLTGRLLPAGATGAQPEAQVVSPPPQALLTRLESLVGSARTAHGTFESRLGTARRSVGAARGAARASDAWINAQVALSSLQSARSDTMIALADLDLLVAQEWLERDTQDMAAIEAARAARDTVAGWADEEDRAIASLTGSLR